MAVSDRPPETATLPDERIPAVPAADGSVDRARPAPAAPEFFYFALRNPKFVLGFASCCMLGSRSSART